MRYSLSTAQHEHALSLRRCLGHGVPAPASIQELFVSHTLITVYNRVCDTAILFITFITFSAEVMILNYQHCSLMMYLSLRQRPRQFFLRRLACVRARLLPWPVARLAWSQTR